MAIPDSKGKLLLGAVLLIFSLIIINADATRLLEPADLIKNSNPNCDKAKNPNGCLPQPAVENEYKRGCSIHTQCRRED